MADEAIKTLAVKVALQDGSFRDGMNSLKRQMQAVDSNFKTSVTGLKNWGGTLDGLKNNTAALSEKVNLQKQIVDQYGSALNKSKTALEQNAQKMQDNKAKLDSARQAYEESAKTLGKNADETKKLKEQMDSAQKAYDSSEALVRKNNKAVEGYTIQLNNANGKLKEFQGELEATNAKIARLKWNELKTQVSGVGKSFESTGKVMTSAGEKMTAGVTAPLLGIAAAAINTGNEFEAQMSRVKAISGATGSDFEALNNQALKLGADTAFSASEAAQGMENLASAGLSTKEIMAAMPGMLDLAASSGEELATSADIAASTLRGFGLSADQAGHVADVLAANAAKTNAAVADTGDAMKYIAPVANAAGWSLESVTAAIGEMADAGIKGEQAGTTLRGALTRLQKPTKQMKEAMDGLKFSAYDTHGKMKPLSQIISELNTKTAKLTDEQRDNALATIFGTESLSGMKILLKDGSKGLNELTKSYQNSNGAAKEMAETMQNNTKGAIEQMKGSIESLAIKFQQTAAPAVKAVADKIQELTNKVLNMSPAQQEMLLKLAGVTAAAGPAAIGLGKIVEATGKLHTGFANGMDAIGNFADKGKSKISDFAKTMSGVGGKVGNLSAVKKMEASVGSLGTKFKSVTSPVTASLAKIKSAITTNLGGATSKLFDKLPNGLKTNLTKMSAQLTGALPKLKGPLNTLGSGITGGLQKVVSGALKVFAPGVLVAAIVTGLGAADSAMGGQLNTMIQTVTEKGPQIIENLVNGITSKIPALVAEGATIVTTLIDAITANGPAIIAGAVQIITALVTGLANNLDKLIPAALSCITTLVNALIDNLPLILQAGSKLLVALVQGITSNPTQLVNTIVSIVMKIATVLIQNLPLIIEAAIKIMVALITGLTQAIPQLIASLPKIISAIREGLLSADWADLGLNILKGIGTGLLQVGKALGGIIKSAGSALVNGFKAVFGIHSPSTVFRDEIGKNLGLGMVEGFQSEDFMQMIADTIEKNGDKPKNATKAVAELTSRQVQKIKDDLAQSLKGLNNQLSALSTAETVALRGVKGSSRYAIQDAYNRKKAAIKSEISMRKDQANKEIAEIQRIGKASKEELEQEIQDRKNFVSDVNDLVSEIKDDLKKKYEAEEQAQEKHINKELDKLEDWKTKSENMINNVYSDKIQAAENAADTATAAIQKELDALEDKKTEDDRAETRKGYTDKISGLKSEIKYSHDAYNTAQLQKQLTQTQAEYQKELDNEALEDKKATLNSQMNAIKDNLEKQKVALQDEQQAELDHIAKIYNARKKSLDNQLQKTKDTYAKMTEDAQLEAQAEQMIMKNNQDEIIALLNSYSDTYKLTGQTLGDKLAEGFQPAIDRIKNMISSIDDAISSARNSALSALSEAKTAKAAASSSYATSKTVRNNIKINITSPVKQTPSQQTRQAAAVVQRALFQVG